MSIKNLFTSNTKGDQFLQVKSINSEDFYTDYEQVDIIYGDTPSIGRTFSIIRYSDLDPIPADSSIDLNIDCTNLNLLEPLVFVTYNRLGAPEANMEQLVVSVVSSTSNEIIINLRNVHGTIATDGTFMALNLMVIGI